MSIQKIKEIKIREENGSYSDPIPLGADAKNIDMENGENIEEIVNNLIADVDIAKTDIENNISAIALNTNRLNNLAKLSEGSTTGDAELVDIRTNYKGYIFDNAGNAVRQSSEESLRKIDNYISTTSVYCSNFLKDIKCEEDYFYNTQDNRIQKIFSKASNSKIIGFIPIKKDTLYYFKNLYAYYCFLWYIDESIEKFEKENTVPVFNGTIMAKNDGYAFITINKTTNSYLFTDSEIVYNNNINGFSFNIENIDSELIKNVYPYLNVFRDYTITAETFNGAERNGEEIIIPSGMTGASSYVGRVFDVSEYFDIGDEIPFIAEVNTDNLNLTISANYINGTIVKRLIEILPLRTENKRFYYGTLNYSSNSPFKIFIQLSSTQKEVEEEKHFSFENIYILSRKYADIVSNIEKLIYLDVGANKTYTSLRRALEYASNHYSKNKKYVIRLFDEEYDVAHDLTENELSTASSYIGLSVTKNVKILGMNNYRNTKIKLELDENLPESVRKRISTLNLYDNAELENLTIYAKTARYAVHDDFLTITEENIEKTIKNCYFISDNTYYHRAYGAGYRSGMKWIFENCLFENKEESTYAPFSAHNNVNFIEPATLKFINCRFLANQGHGAMFGSLTESSSGIKTNILNTIIFEGCKTLNTKDGDIYLYQEAPNTNGKGCLVSVTGFGNSFTKDNIIIQTTDGKDYSNQIDIF